MATLPVPTREEAPPSFEVRALSAQMRCHSPDWARSLRHFARAALVLSCLQAAWLVWDFLIPLEWPLALGTVAGSGVPLQIRHPSAEELLTSATRAASTHFMASPASTAKQCSWASAMLAVTTTTSQSTFTP